MSTSRIWALRHAAIVSCVAAVLGAGGVAAAAQPESGGVTVRVNSEPVRFGAGDGPRRVHGQLVVPLRAVLEALGAAARGEVPPRGPRGGVRWAPRYFVRRVVWHVLDHARELEDRLT